MSVTAPEPFSIQAEHVVNVNYFSSLRVCETLFPILKLNAQVINVSSACGHLSRIPSSIRSQFGNPKLTISELNDLMNLFVKDAKEGKCKERGWGTSKVLPYVVSKVGISALTIIQQRIFDNEDEKRNISVNSVYPGFVPTDMTNHMGLLTVERGAQAPLFLALESHNWKGQYIWHDSTVVDWFAPETPDYY